MNLVFSYRECRAALLADDWQEIENGADWVVYAKGDSRATLRTEQITITRGSGNREIVVCSEGIEFTRHVNQANENGYCKLKAIPTEPGWIAHREPKQEAAANEQF